MRPARLQPALTPLASQQTHERIPSAFTRRGMRPHPLDGDEVLLGDQRWMHDRPGHHPLIGPRPPLRPERSGQMRWGVVGRLTVPHLPPCVLRIHQNRPYGRQPPRDPGPMRIPRPINARRTRHTRAVEFRGDARHTPTAQTLGKDPPHGRRRHRVRIEPLQPPAPLGVHRVRVRPSIDEPISEQWTAAEEPAFVACLAPHRLQRSPPRPQHLPFGLRTQQHHQCPMRGVAEIERAMCFRQPQLHALRLEQGQHRQQLRAVERTLVLTHNYSVEATIRLRKLLQQRRRLRPIRPGQPPAPRGVKVVHHDPAVAGDQLFRCVALPSTRR